MERRAICRETEFQTREADGNLYIEGYFSVFNSKYWIFEDVFETVDPGAFNLSRDTDVRALANHDSTLVLGRTTAGTLTLSTDERGLYGIIQVNRADQDAMNIYARVQRGDVTQCSFGFDLLRQEEIREGGTLEWRIMDAKLFEVSVCTFPAYEETEVQARMRDIEAMKRREAEAFKARLITKLRGTK